MVKSPTPRSRRHDCSFTKQEKNFIIKQRRYSVASPLCPRAQYFKSSCSPAQERLQTAHPALQRHRRRHQHQSGEDTDCRHAQEHCICASIFREKSHQEHCIGRSQIRYQLQINLVHSSSGAPFKFQGAKKVMCWAALVGNSVLTLRWMDEDYRPCTSAEESYGEMLQNEVWPEVQGRAGSVQGNRRGRQTSAPLRSHGQY